MPVAQLAHAFEVARRRHERAAGVLDRLDDDHGDGLGARLSDRPVELVEQEGGELLLRLVRRPVVAVRVRHVKHIRDERLERGPQLGAAVDGEGAHGGPVVGHAAGDRLPAPLPACRVVLASELPGRLDRLGAAGYEEHPVEVAGRECRNLARELYRAGMGKRPVDRERQLAHLRRGGLAHLLAEAVADVHAEEARERIEIAPAVRRLRGGSRRPGRSPGAPRRPRTSPSP